MTDLRESLINALSPHAAESDSTLTGLACSCGEWRDRGADAWDYDLHITDALLPVIAAHEAEVVGRILDRIDALHCEHDCERDGAGIRWECFIVHGGACANVGRCRGCGLAQNAPCPTRRLTAEIRGELSNG